MTARETATPVPHWTVRDRWLRTAPKTDAAVLGLGLLAFAAAGPAGAAEQGKLVRVTPGQSPFAGCTADRVDQQEGVNYPNTEIEPFVDATTCLAHITTRTPFRPPAQKEPA